MSWSRNKRPLSPAELAERRRTVPLSYIAACWKEYERELYDKTRLILSSVSKLKKHFPDKDAVTEKEFISMLIQYVNGSDKTYWKRIYSDVWHQALYSFERDTRKILKPKPFDHHDTPDLSTGLSPRNH